MRLTDGSMVLALLLSMGCLAWVSMKLCQILLTI